MAKCTYWNVCPFLREMMGDMPLASNRLQKIFCDDRFEDCARFHVYAALGTDAVPYDLYPSMRKRADAIIANGGEEGIQLENVRFDPTFLDSLSKHDLVALLLKLKKKLDDAGVK